MISMQMRLCLALIFSVFAILLFKTRIKHDLRLIPRAAHSEQFGAVLPSISAINSLVGRLFACDLIANFKK